MIKQLLICGVLLCTGLIYSQEVGEGIESLDEVVLIDSKFKMDRENSGKVVTKITSAELAKSAGRTIPEVINRVSGIEINGARSADGQNLGYYFRGSRNREVVILIDGIQVNDPSSISNDFDLRLLPLDQVESIEILKGASSTLYGSGAAAAVINIILKEPAYKPISLQVQTVWGSNNTQENQDYDIAQYDNSVGLSGRLSKFNYQVNFSNRFSRNMSAVESLDENEIFEEDPFRKHNLYARIGYKINDHLKFYAYGNLDKFRSSYDDSFMFTDADNFLISEQIRTGSHWEATYKNGSFNFSDSYSKLEREVISDFSGKYDSKIYAFDANNKYIFNQVLHTIIGVNGIFSSFNSYSIPFGETNFSQTVSEEVANFDIVDPYLNVVFLTKFGLNINAGTRLNIHSEYGTHWVYNFNPSYNINLREGKLKTLASYSTAYITPSLYQLFDLAYGNVDLRPEESVTIEGGLEYMLRNNRFSAVYFRRNSENFVDFVVVDPASFTYQYQNISEDFTARGVEVEVNLQINQNITLGGNYTFTEVEERFGLRIPKHKVNAQLGYQLSDKTFTSLSYQFNDDRNDSYFNNETFETDIVVLQSFGLLDYYLGHQINDNVKLFLGITNITNEDYQEIYRFNTHGRNVRIGLNIQI